jgi:hypothetical protein
MMATTMTVSQAIDKLAALQALHGDVPMVLWDMDTSWYFALRPECFEAQQMEDGSVRISVGPDGGYGQDMLPAPAKRPL